MREILFRGKRKDCKAWEIGDYSKYDFQAGRKHFINGLEYEVYPETVGQFTGLTDKNGKKIFEGDIVKEEDVVHNGEIQIPGHIFTVVMRKGCWCVIPPNDADQWDFLNSYTRLIEVIGNIHDNQELLEV